MLRIKHCLYGILVVCLTVLVLLGDRSQAEEPDKVEKYDQQISEARKKQKGYEEETERLQQELEEIEKAKDKTLLYIEKLDKKSSSLEESLEDLKERIQKTGSELQNAGKELAQAEKTEEKQYAVMKKRIKYMYENGNQDYLEILFSSRDIGELLNRTEYIEKISSYDRNIFKEYVKTKEDIRQRKKQIEGKLSDLEDMQAEETAEKEALNDLRKKKKQELGNYKKQITVSQEKSDEYARQAAEAEAEVEKLLQEKQAEIDRQNAVGAGNSGGDGTLRWPLDVAGRISSRFGKRGRPTAGASTYHKGIDIAVSHGTPVVAAGAGNVVTASYSSSAGNYVMISHGDRLFTVYMHCSRLAVKKGDTVIAGQRIAYVGSTGISTGPHLHFGVSKNGSYVDPLTYVNQK